MATVSRSDVVSFAVVLSVVTWMGFDVGYRGYLQPIIERGDKLRSQMAKIRTQKQWVRRLKAKISQMERKLKVLSPLLDDLQTYLIRDEPDRFRLALGRDLAAKSIKNLVVSTAETASPPSKLAFRNPVDPNEQLSRLRQSFLKDNPRAVFTRWVVPSSLDAFVYSERFTVESSIKDLLLFLGKVTADPLLMEVTELKVSGAETGTRSTDRIIATVELSALGLPLAETGQD